MLGKFHEISVETEDIADSVAFYERLGFSHCGTTDTWQHPYGVMTDGKLFLGLHQFKFPSPTLTYVHANVAQHCACHREAGHRHRVEARRRRRFQRIRLPRSLRTAGASAGSAHAFLRRRASATMARCAATSPSSACPPREFQPMREFWEPLGFVALDETEAPYLRMSMTSDHLDLAVHRPRTLDAPMLVFAAADMGERIERLRALGWRCRTSCRAASIRGIARCCERPKAPRCC